MQQEAKNKLSINNKKKMSKPMQQEKSYNKLRRKFQHNKKAMIAILKEQHSLALEIMRIKIDCIADCMVADKEYKAILDAPLKERHSLARKILLDKIGTIDEMAEYMVKDNVAKALREVAQQNFCDRCHLVKLDSDWNETSECEDGM